MATGPKQLMEKLVPQKVRELVDVYLKTFFRHDFDRTGLTKSKIMFSNFLLHIQPVKVHKRSLQFRTTLGLGLISFYLFLILVFSGILLMFHYVPSDTIGPDGFPVAYQRMLNLRSNIFWGGFLRNMHRWAAHAMVLAVWLHMLRVFLTGAYSKPREFNWLIGCVLGLLTVFMSYTGYLLPWDQLAYWGGQGRQRNCPHRPRRGDHPPVPAGRLGCRQRSPAAFLRVACRRAADGDDAPDRLAFLAHPQGWRPGPSGRAG